jgi:ribonuclease P protein component
MINRKHRFHGHASINKVYPKTKIIRGSLVSLRYAKRPPNKPYRIAVVVGRKVNKSAVKRNRIRRRLYETVRTSDMIPASTDLIFNVYSDQLAEIDYLKLKQQIKDLLNKVS